MYASIYLAAVEGHFCQQLLPQVLSSCSVQLKKIAQQFPGVRFLFSDLHTVQHQQSDPKSSRSNSFSKLFYLDELDTGYPTKIGCLDLEPLFRWALLYQGSARTPVPSRIRPGAAPRPPQYGSPRRQRTPRRCGREEPMRRWRLSKYPVFARWLLQKFASWGPIVVFIAGDMLQFTMGDFVWKHHLFAKTAYVNVGIIWPFCSRFMSPPRQCCLPNVDCTIVVNVIISSYLHGFQNCVVPRAGAARISLSSSTPEFPGSEFASGGESFDDSAFATNCDFRTWNTWDGFGVLRRNFLCSSRVAGSATGA